MGRVFRKEVQLPTIAGTHLDLLDQILLESRKDNLSLTGFKTVRHGRDGSDIIGHGEQNQLLVDEVLDGYPVDVVVQIGARLVIEATNMSFGRSRKRALAANVL